MALEKVLVVDDDPNICEVLRMYLENEGYSVILSYDGEEALVKFNALKPDVILLDAAEPGWLASLPGSTEKVQRTDYHDYRKG